MDHSQVIIRPVVSEKSYVLAANDKYTFRVHPDAHKTQIRQAVEALFDVKVVAVRPKMLDIKNPDYEKHNHLEEVELRYEQITWSYKDGNIIHKDTWNERA